MRSARQRIRPCNASFDDPAGIRQSVQRLSSVFSPVAYGLIITAYGLAAGFFAGALTFAAAVPVMARLTRELSDHPDY